ncbi:hypothetical protein MKX01_003435 [Papaver californicum]|nr:hypothetical protein MKX01_003435 [Papaver californicum]
MFDAKTSARGCPPCPMIPPWLVFRHGNKGKHQVFCDPFDPSNRTYRKAIPEMRYQAYYQSPCYQGWLIMLLDDEKESKYGDCFLWNPETLEKFQLPTLSHWMNKYHMRSFVLSPPPLASNDFRDFVVYFLFHYSGHTKSSCFYFLLYCHPGDKHWRVQNLPRSIKEDYVIGRLSCLNGRLYIICFDGLLVEIEKKTQHESNDYVEGGNYDDETAFKITSLSIEGNIVESGDDGLFMVPPLPVGLISHSQFSHQQRNTVESDDELFMVVRHYHHPYFSQMDPIDLQVFRLDFSLMAWEELKSLGDHVFFLDSGNPNSVSCSATELGLARGCVYFTLSNDRTLYKFDIEDRSLEFSLPCPSLPTPWFSPSWMTIEKLIELLCLTCRAADGRRRQRLTVRNDLIGDNEEEHIPIESTEERKASSKDDGAKEILRKNNGGELEEEEESRHTTWGSMSPDILELISSYLHLLDYIHFRAVCRANRLATTTKMKHTQHTSLPPWLIFLKVKDGVYNLAGPTSIDRFFLHQPNMLVDATICFSKGGWLLMSKGNRTIFFYNPFTRAMIHLPDLPDYPGYICSGMSFSSLPTSSDCVVMGISDAHSGHLYDALRGQKQVWIFSLTRGDDSWEFDQVDNSPELPSEELKSVTFAPWRNNPVFYNGYFYCLDIRGNLGFVSVENYTWGVLDKPHGPCNSINQSFLVECEGNLLAVFLSKFRTCVKVFRLDMDRMVWFKVESLGKYMLFISNTSSLSAIAPNSHMENKIYFPRFHGEDIVYYSLDTCKYHTFGSQDYSGTDFYNTKEQLYCSWIEPNWSQTTAQELDWSPITKEVEV